MLYLGIDQHAMQLTVCVRNEFGSICLRRQVSTVPHKVRAFFDDIHQQADPLGGWVVMLEICGFNDWLLKLLEEVGCREIIVVQPNRASTRKTDRRDAASLAEVLWVNRERLLAGRKAQGVRRIELPTPQEAADRQLTALRQRLGKEQTRVINRIKHILFKHNLQHQLPTKTFQTQVVRRWLAQLELSPVDRLELDQLLVHWKMLIGQIKVVQEQILERCRTHRQAQLIGSLTGRAGYAALAIACRIGSIERFARGGSLANYWGLTPTSNSSGGKIVLGHISREGSAVVRFLLAQLVLHALKRDAGLKAWYQRVKKRRGARIARVGVMRKLATSIWSMIKHNQPYIPVNERKRPPARAS